jgi:hypothetical protein
VRWHFCFFASREREMQARKARKVMDEGSRARSVILTSMNKARDSDPLIVCTRGGINIFSYSKTTRQSPRESGDSSPHSSARSHAPQSPSTHPKSVDHKMTTRPALSHTFGRLASIAREAMPKVDVHATGAPPVAIDALLGAAVDARARHPALCRGRHSCGRRASRMRTRSRHLGRSRSVGVHL